MQSLPVVRPANITRGHPVRAPRLGLKIHWCCLKPTRSPESRSELAAQGEYTFKYRRHPGLGAAPAHCLWPGYLAGPQLSAPSLVQSLSSSIWRAPRDFDLSAPQVPVAALSPSLSEADTVLKLRSLFGAQGERQLHLGQHLGPGVVSCATVAGLETPTAPLNTDAVSAAVRFLCLARSGRFITRLTVQLRLRRNTSRKRTRVLERFEEIYTSAFCFHSHYRVNTDAVSAAVRFLCLARSGRFITRLTVKLWLWRNTSRKRPRVLERFEEIYTVSTLVGNTSLMQRIC
ncbi:hypothetical protein NDU88_003659 [Pleurodeles waltl]|uniref:Uncharacterized protein n=1 Tax=Pleurodeles waltl TaxID=8319 RepID=A0AAV7UFU2_PLEWA|nr:hypothetical protein NDU88_003659 [Pleurodeles waltl]